MDTIITYTIRQYFTNNIHTLLGQHYLETNDGSHLSCTYAFEQKRN